MIQTRKKRMPKRNNLSPPIFLSTEQFNIKWRFVFKNMKKNLSSEEFLNFEPTKILSGKLIRVTSFFQNTNNMLHTHNSKVNGTHACTHHPQALHMPCHPMTAHITYSPSHQSLSIHHSLFLLPPPINYPSTTFPPIPQLFPPQNTLSPKTTIYHSFAPHLSLNHSILHHA